MKRRWFACAVLVSAVLKVDAQVGSGPELRELLELARISAHVYEEGAGPVLGGWKRTVVQQERSGLDWAIYSRISPTGRREIVVAFAGTEFADHRDMATNAAKHLGVPLWDDQYRDALTIASTIEARFGGSAKITVTGHSLGGALAKFAAVGTGLEAVAFDPAPFGVGPLLDADWSALPDAHDRIRSVHLRGEAVHSLWGVQLGREIEFEPPPGVPGIHAAGVPHLAYIDSSSVGSAIRDAADAFLGEPFVRRHSIALLAEAIEYEAAYGAARRVAERSMQGWPGDRVSTGAMAAPAIPVPGGVRVLRTTAENLAATTGSLIAATANLEALAQADSPSLREAARRLEKLGSADPHWAGRLEVVTRLYDFYRAVENDIAASRKSGRFVLLTSHTVEKSAELGIDAMLPRLFDSLRRRGAIARPYPTLGAIDFLKAGSRHIGSGTVDIDTLTLYLDGATALAWGGLGLAACAGQSTCASVYQSVGKSLASSFRDSTSGLFATAAVRLTGQGQTLVDAWSTLQARRLHDGLSVLPITAMYGRSLLRANGVSERTIEALDQRAHEANRQLIAAKRESNFETMSEAFTEARSFPERRASAPALDLGGIEMDPKPRYVEDGRGDGGSLEDEASRILQGRTGGRSWRRGADATD